MHVTVQTLAKSLIVSCQAEGDDPFNTPERIALFARAAEMGGARGIRACGDKNIRAVKQAVGLPVIGLTKGRYSDGTVLITADFADVDAIARAGADIIALDATARKRPNGLMGADFLAGVKTRHALPIMADISSLEEALAAQTAGADMVGTTLAGYTSISRTEAENVDEPDWRLLGDILQGLTIPVILEGRVWLPEQARRALNMGCHAVVVGSAITRPRLITRRFANAMRRI